MVPIVLFDQIYSFDRDAHQGHSSYREDDGSLLSTERLRLTFSPPRGFQAAHSFRGSGVASSRAITRGLSAYPACRVLLSSACAYVLHRTSPRGCPICPRSAALHRFSQPASERSDTERLDVPTQQETGCSSPAVEWHDLTPAGTHRGQFNARCDCIDRENVESCSKLLGPRKKSAI